KNGNINRLFRNGVYNTIYGRVDDLSYSYIGNQLTKVTENGSSLIKSEGFKDVNNAIDYTYDVNGNMTKDLNKGITDISYNHLNLPTKIHFRNGGSIDYKYDARGVKLEKEARGEYGDPTSTQYAGNYIYKKNPGRGAQLKLAFFNHPEGYVSPKNASDISQGFKYVYQYKDHLGNVRLSYTDNNNDGVITPSTEIIEESNYYPFGLKHKGYNNVVNSLGNSTAQKFGYNGKELNEELGIQWHDFGARNYDASLGRWMNLDPHADNYYSLSPYNSFANNPLSFVDPDGKDILFWQKNKKGKWKQVEFSKLNKDTQKSIEAFAKTKEGNSFLKDFANKGDKIGEVEFGEDGKYAKHELSIGEFSKYYGGQGTSNTKHKKGDNKLTIEIELNNTGDYEHSRTAQMANTIGHEAFVHTSQYVYDLIEAFDNGNTEKVNKILKKRRSVGGNYRTPEHTGYVRGTRQFKRMKTYLSQLRTVLNPKEVEKARKQDINVLKRNGNK
ncbi:RHS repeat domain-containing protein, partial [Tenacibaculum maritimum]|uniref:RHS repeat domain-containing protein n=1 Tax=Tenacibaculum maritimum TaxID=107401 RepID=UPI0019152FD3